MYRQDAPGIGVFTRPERNLQTCFGKYKLVRVNVVTTVGKRVVKLYAALGPLENFLDDFFGLINPILSVNVKCSVYFKQQIGRNKNYTVNQLQQINNGVCNSICRPNKD